MFNNVSMCVLLNVVSVFHNDVQYLLNVVSMCVNALSLFVPCVVTMLLMLSTWF